MSRARRRSAGGRRRGGGVVAPSRGRARPRHRAGATGSVRRNGSERAAADSAGARLLYYVRARWVLYELLVRLPRPRLSLVNGLLAKKKERIIHPALGTSRARALPEAEATRGARTTARRHHEQPRRRVDDVLPAAVAVGEDDKLRRGVHGLRRARRRRRASAVVRREWELRGERARQRERSSGATTGTTSIASRLVPRLRFFETSGPIVPPRARAFPRPPRHPSSSSSSSSSSL